MTDNSSGTDGAETNHADDQLPQPDPARDKPSQAEGGADESQRVSPVDPAGNKPSQAEGDVGDFGDK